MIDLQKGIIPAEEDEEDEAMMEEARRLFYVGITRAKERLELLSYRNDEGKKKEDSRFVNEVRGLLLKPKELKAQIDSGEVSAATKAAIPINPNGITNGNEIKKGVIVKHRVFGQGEIISREGKEIHIQFDKMKKKLDLDTVLSMRLLEIVAP